MNDYPFHMATDWGIEPRLHRSTMEDNYPLTLLEFIQMMNYFLKLFQYFENNISCIKVNDTSKESAKPQRFGTGKT